MSASRGRTRLMEWIVRHSSEAFINARDRESGYTPLHRSIFYGQIHAAVALLKIGKMLCHLKFPAPHWLIFKIIEMWTMIVQGYFCSL